MTIRVKGGEEEDGGGAGRSGRERREKRGEKETEGEEERQAMEGKRNTTLWMGRREEMYLIEEQRVFSRVGGRVEGVQWLSPAILLTYLL